jgi:PAS domain-containing protein
VKSRTAALTRALEAQHAVTDRLRATFATDLIFQGFLDTAGTLLDANPASLAAIGKSLEEVRGRPFWDTEWFSATPGIDRQVREWVEAAARGMTVRAPVTVQLPDGPRSFRFLLRPALNAQGQVVGLVPEAVEIETESVQPDLVSAAAEAAAAAAPSRTAASP